MAIVLALALTFAVVSDLRAQTPSGPILSLRIGGGGQELSMALRILLLLTLLTFLPALLLCLTSFTRILVVLALLRQALGLMHMPPNQVLIGLSLILTFFTMAPVGDKIYREAVAPCLAQEIPFEEAASRAIPPLRDFMLKQTREKDLALFLGIAKVPKPRNPQEVPMRVLVPAFIISELKTAFQIGFLLYVPFLVIDMVVASILLSMGMFMLPPVMVSLPFKLMLFVLVDGWNLILGSLMRSFL